MDEQTDGQTNGNVIPSTALATRALQRAVVNDESLKITGLVINTNDV